jgi:hypothetical protein
MSPILVTESGIVSDVRSVCQKARRAIDLKPEPNVREVKDAPSNAYSPIVVTESGITTDVRAVPINALEPMDVTVFPSIVPGIARSLGQISTQPVIVILLPLVV